MNVKIINNITLNKEPVALAILPARAAFHLNNVNARSQLIYIKTHEFSSNGRIWCFQLDELRCGDLVALSTSTPVWPVHITLTITSG
jgi:hypothetical protein